MRNIIITGGELFNKGAQAMTFVTVNEICKRFPKHKIYLLSEMDLQRSEAEKRQYVFDFMGWYPGKFARCQSNVLLRVFCKIRNGRELAEAENIYKYADAMIDISGYALGSNWSAATCNRYLNHLEFAHAFNIPVYLMPQSFGPFDFEGEEGSQIDNRIRKLLPAAKVIFAREQEGYDALVNRYGLTNVRLANDLVLSNKGIDLKNIFREIPAMNLPDIRENSVAIIPNMRNTEVGNHEVVLGLYDRIISELIQSGKAVYLLSHSTMDRKLCLGIKARFADVETVVCLDQDFSCLEFNELVKKFRFLVASRFHSIVHAYKNAIPCIALGWATKYHDLLKLFGQERYIFDVRDNVEVEKILLAINRLDGHRQEESEKIQSCLAEIQKNNVFDVLSEK